MSTDNEVTYARLHVDIIEAIDSQFEYGIQSFLKAESKQDCCDFTILVDVDSIGLCRERMTSYYRYIENLETEKGFKLRCSIPLDIRVSDDVPNFFRVYIVGCEL